jgi:hypothetical protein
MIELFEVLKTIGHWQAIGSIWLKEENNYLC